MNKQKILKILNNLRPYRELADGMIALIEAGFMDKETYQNMLFMFSAAIKQIPEGEEKEKLKMELYDLKETNQKGKKEDETD